MIPVKHGSAISIKQQLPAVIADRRRTFAGTDRCFDSLGGFLLKSIPAFVPNAQMFSY
jgi:hypothetical protein